MYDVHFENTMIKPRPDTDGGAKRKHIWNISSDLFCSVCGTCLDFEEQKKILKKLHMDHQYLSEHLTEHDIHSLMVNSLHSENRLSRRLESHLNDKYRYELTTFGEHDEKQFMAVWKEHLKSGDICGLYWLAVTHKGLSENAMHSIYCDVHMMSHLNGGKTRQEKKEQERLLGVNAELQAKLRQEKKRSKELTKALALSEQSNRSMASRVQKLETTLPAPQALPSPEVSPDLPSEDLRRENRELHTRLAQAESALHDFQVSTRGWAKEKERLEEDLRGQREINLQLFGEIENLMRSFACDQQECGQNACCGGSLCAKRVLIVGGLTKLRSFYRDIVENLGGSFAYHDGYVHAGERELEGLIKKSDIILCPVDCNSHGACLSVKKICNRINKPYQMLPSSSLSSISQALTDSAAVLK